MSSHPPRAPLPPVSRLLLVLLFVSLLPALLLAWNRVQYERAQRSVAVVMDYQALRSQATELGLDWRAVLRDYRALGVNGLGVYEDVIADLSRRGEILFRTGAEILAEFPDSGVHPDWTYLHSVKPGAAEALPARYTYRTETVTVDGRKWIGWPVDPRYLPAGPDEALVDELRQDGLQILYRPSDQPALKLSTLGSDWPDVPFVAFVGDQVVADDDPERLARVDEALGNRALASIEAYPQEGLEDLIANHATLRLFSIRPEWQKRLEPGETASKFVLAARERNHRLLYVRPFAKKADTETFLRDVKTGLDRARIAIGAPDPRERYEPNPALRWLSMVGPFLALALLALSFPLRRLGWILAVLTAALAFGVNFGTPFGGAALLAALVFPTVGFVMRRERPTDWLIATGFSLIGVLFVAALGTDRLSMLGLDPFRGVGLTLLVPVVLFAFSLLPRQDVRKTAADLYAYPLKLGDVAIVVVGLAAVMLIFLRRGNTPAIGVSEVESKIRVALQDTIIRPRFKELAGHPLAILGLSKRFPPYFSTLLLMVGVFGQASILNTFSHFHTPLLISLQRAFNGIAIGGVAGFVLLPIVTWGIRFLTTRPGGPAPTAPAPAPRQEGERTA